MTALSRTEMAMAGERASVHRTAKKATTKKSAPAARSTMTPEESARRIVSTLKAVHKALGESSEVPPDVVKELSALSRDIGKQVDSLYEDASRQENIANMLEEVHVALDGLAEEINRKPSERTVRRNRR